MFPSKPLHLNRVSMFKAHLFAPPLLGLAILVSSALADTVVLKTGERLEGKVTAETDNDITMQVQVAAGITDEKTIPKAQIDRVQKTAADVAAFQKLLPIQLGKDSMTVAQYDPYIRALQEFITTFPNSSRLADVQKTLDAFKEEKQRVEKGEIKMDGQWMSKAQVEKEKVQIGGQLALSYMKSQSAQGDWVGALNTFAAIEKNFAGAVAMPDAVDLAQKDLIQLQGAVERAIPEQKALVERQKKEIAAESSSDRAVMSGAIKREQDAQDAAVQANAAPWPPFFKNNEKSLAGLESKVRSEGPRIAGLPVQKMRDSLQLTLAAKQDIASNDFTGAGDKLKQATTLWAANELANRLSKEVAEQAKVAAVAAAATPVPTPKPPPIPMPTPKPAPVATPVPAVPPPSGTTAAAPAADSGDDDRPFLLTIPGALSVIVALTVVFGGANFYLKMKKRKAGEAENV
jgi:hypothetical protein